MKYSTQAESCIGQTIPERLPQVENWLIQTIESADRLSRAVQDLSARLSPVLGHSALNEANNQSAPEVSLCPVANTLRDLNKKLTLIAVAVRDIHERVEC